MSHSSPRLDLPYLQPAQAQKHVTHNEALLRLDGLVQLVLQDGAAETPPASPAPGEAWGLAASPTGAWAGHGDQIAIWQGEGWLFLDPAIGWRAWDLAATALRVWDGSAWVTPQQQDRLGIATSPDNTNRLAVASDAVLFTHAGGDQQVKVNKSGDAQTASLVFQSNWAGHAEMGLAGSTDFSIKVSGGGSWPEALVVKSATARVGLGTSTPGARLALSHGGSGDDYLLAGEASALFRLGADGNGSCAGSWSGGGADFAEYFEWQDRNPGQQDRRGLSVALGAKGRIRPAQAGETPIGVVSALPCLIGNDDCGAWQGRWQRDAFGALLRDDAGLPLVAPEYDPDRPYQPRATRAEWAVIGMMGRVLIRRGQPVDRRWIRLGAAEDLHPAGTAAPDLQLDIWLLR